MHKFNFRNPPHAAVIAVMLALCVGIGFLADAIWTLAEKTVYPRTYADLVTDISLQTGVPETVLYGVMKSESNFDTGAVSSAGAVGLMQLMPDTFRWITDEMLFEHLEDGMMYDPETSIRYGAWLLARYYARYGNWQAALAAYNAGPGRVDEWLADEKYADGNGGLEHIPYRETRQYVSRVTRVADAYRRLYGYD